MLALLARAVQQLHTYPATSPLCLAALDACGRGFAALGSRDRLTFRVTPADLLVDGLPTGGGTIVGRELARRLHKAAVAAVAIDRDVSPRELARFCEDLVRAEEEGRDARPFIERIDEHGIERIVVEPAARPQVLEVPAQAPGRAEALARERARFEAHLASGEPFRHLYPPHAGWVRLDPAAAPNRVSLLDLAILAEDPAALASMLLRLTDDGAEESPSAALQKKYSDVALVISSLEPGTARRLLGRLARAVLDLDPEARRALLKRAVLPGLLDGGVDGAILRDFPDVDLADSLCLLLDLEAAAPELLSAALSRLDLPAERRETVLPLLERKLKEREAGEAGRHATLARHARELVRVDATAPRAFTDFAAFDLSLDDGTLADLAALRRAVPETDHTVERLTCLWHLIRLERNPEPVGRFMQRSFVALADLEQGGRGGALPTWLGRYRAFAEDVRVTRPDVASAIDAYLDAFCTPERAAWLVDLSLHAPDGRAAADTVITAVGGAITAPLVALANREPRDAGAGTPDTRRAALHLLTAHIRRLAPAVPPLLEGCVPPVRRALIRAMGDAGPGYEETLSRFVTTGDEGIAREALRALARVGTPAAADLVAGEIVRQRGALRLAAEETLWHFPLDQAQRHARALLGRRDFAVQHPDAAERLLDRAARAGARDLHTVLTGLAPMRFRIWNPGLARVARKAHRMLQPPTPPAGAAR